MDFEKLEVYGLAREFICVLQPLLRKVPAVHADAVDQLRRASLSVVLNIAEGAGEFAPKEKARFYRIAKRSCTESAAVLNYLVDLRLCSAGDVSAAKLLARRVTGALVRLIQSTERLPRP